MKAKILRAMSISLAACMLCVGCTGNKGGEGEMEIEKKNETAPPDYSKDARTVDMYAFIGPTDGSYYTSAGQLKYGEDHRTKERYQEYKDCGMNILLLLGNNLFMGSGDRNITEEAELAAFEASRVKIDLDLSEEVGLKTIVFDNRIWRLSTCHSPLIKTGDTAEPLWFVCGQTYYSPEKVQYDATANVVILEDGKQVKVNYVQYQFDSMEALQSYVKLLMCSYKDHPAFYGVSLYDEPGMEKLAAVGQVTQAIRGLYPDCYIHTCLLPYYGGGGELLTVGTEKGFLEYLDTYLEESQNDHFCYDFYPLRGDVTSTGGSDEYSLHDTLVRTLQISAKKALEKKVKWEITIQSYGTDVEPTRFVNEDDIRLQSNLALAFDAEKISYFTYWMWQNKTGHTYHQAIMGDNGEKILYDEVQKVNAETQILAQAVLNYDYVGTCLSWDKDYGSRPTWFTDVETMELSNVKEVTSSGAAVINEMYDAANSLTGYMIVNANDTYEGIENRVSITFQGYTKAVVYTAEGPVEVDLKDGNYTRVMKGGEAVLVVPY